MHSRLTPAITLCTLCKNYHPLKNNLMNRHAFQLKVKQDRIEEYKKHHEAVWPEMLAALTKTGWHNYSLFLHNDGTLFSGWMLASAPALNAMDHPRYDVWALRCITS